MKKRGYLYAGIAVLISLIAGLAVSAWNMTQTSADTVPFRHAHPCSWYCSNPSVAPFGHEYPCWWRHCSNTSPGQTSASAPAPVEATPTQPPAPAPAATTGYTDSSDAAQAVLALINQERASTNLPALQMSSALINSAHLHNIVMFQANTLSHQLFGEADLGTRITAQRVTWTMCAENIGSGYGDATQAAVGLNQAMFAETPPDDGHRQNILSSATLVGIDVIVNTQNAQVWLTEDFAQA